MPAPAVVVSALTPEKSTLELLRGGALMVVRWLVMYPMAYLAYFTRGLRDAPWRSGAARGFEGPGIIVANHRNAFFDVVITRLAGPLWSFFLIDSSRPLTPIVRLGLRLVRGMAFPRGLDGAATEAGKATLRDRQRQCLSRMAEILVNGHWLTVFPEGRADASAGLQPLRYGVSAVAFEAQEKAGWRLPLKIFVLGLHYEEPRIAGSRCDARWDPEPIEVGARYREMYGKDPAAAQKALLNEIETRLKKVVEDGARRRAPRPREGSASWLYRILGYGLFWPLWLGSWPFRAFGRLLARNPAEEPGYSFLLWCLCLVAGFFVSDLRWAAQFALLTFLATRSWLWAWRRGVVK